MTRYDPIEDALEDGITSPTVSDLVEQGYDDFEVKDTGAAGEAVHVALALRAMGELHGDDSLKWYVVNELIAALRAIEETHQRNVKVMLNRTTVTVDPAEEWGIDDMDPYETQEETLSVEASPKR